MCAHVLCVTHTLTVVVPAAALLLLLVPLCCLYPAVSALLLLSCSCRCAMPLLLCCCCRVAAALLLLRAAAALLLPCCCPAAGVPCQSSLLDAWGMCSRHAAQRNSTIHLHHWTAHVPQQTEYAPAVVVQETCSTLCDITSKRLLSCGCGWV
jgi:hypothetical protein